MLFVVVRSVLVILGVVLAWVSGAGLAGGQYLGAQIWRVYMQNATDQDIFQDFERKFPVVETVYQGRSVLDVLVRGSILESAKEHFASVKKEYEVLVDDVEERIKNEDTPMTDDEISPKQGRGYNFTYSHYHPLSDIHDYMDLYLAASPSTKVNNWILGRSFEKRDIKLLEIVNDLNAPYIWIDGGMHAREWLSPTTALWIANLLLREKEKLPEAMKKLNYYILPVMNPDGYEYSRNEDRMWRKNRNLAAGNRSRRQEPSLHDCKLGVDLNRNFDIEWGRKEGASNNACESDYKGPYANSELETQGVVGFLSDKISKVKAFLTFHTYGQYILCPYAYARNAPLLENQLELIKIARTAAKNIIKMSGSNYHVGKLTDFLYACTGTSIDWAASQGIPYVFVMELSKDSFILPVANIIPTAREGLELVKAVAEAIVKRK
ncbi:unnamed protein product [Bemisia tabaci]|uniref:Peptidase M14 domain-containing protein n=1 Tax=Bemisia tabaci TaxID=7038 RepID=A0A9P0F5K4_BEMTA|nr:unnamed protein product [Bemisia tabaci]